MPDRRAYFHERWLRLKADEAYMQERRERENARARKRWVEDPEYRAVRLARAMLYQKRRRRPRAGRAGAHLGA